MQTSLKKFSIVLKQEGTSRQERYVPALHETGKLLDDRKLQDFILYMQEYSKNLLFVNTDKDRIDYEESWEDFFANDPVLLIAHIASANMKKVKEDYDHLYNVFQNGPTIDSFARLTRFVFSRFVLVNKWYLLSSADSMLQQDLYLYIRSYLQKEMEKLKEILLYCFDHCDDDVDRNKKAVISTKNEETRIDLENMVSIWKLDQKEKIALREKIFGGANEKEKLVNAAVILNKTFETIFHATASIAEKSGKYFDETILHKQNHNPHIALVITFIKLFGYEQAELNKIPQRMLNFYYRDFLKIKEKEAVPDQAYVVFELAKGFSTLLLKKGTKLSAGKNKQGNDLVYETDKDVVLSKARVSSLRTAFIDRKENGEILNYYTGIVTPTPGQVASASPGETEHAGMFGEKKPSAITEIGFALASSQLYLAKGERNIVITLNAVKETGPAEPAQKDNQVTDFDTAIFRLLLTGEKGWISSEEEAGRINIKSLKKINDESLELSFSISIAQEQAIVAFNKELHKGNFNTNFPLVQFILKFPPEKELSDNTGELIRQLNILQRFRVAGANIKVTVGSIAASTKISFDGVRDLMLENDDSVLDNKKPFYPFTPIPKVSSSFYIGCKDLFYKKIQQLSINIEWLLPDNFGSYYQKYNAPYDSNKFMASLSYLDKNRWEKYSNISLVDASAAKPYFRIIKINFDKKKSETAAPPDDEVSTFDSTKKNGTLKLKLRYPDFGHNIYPQLITSTVMEKAGSKSENIDYYKLVKKRLHDDIFTIEIPPDINNRNGSLKVMYDILDFRSDEQARSMMINALSDIISKQNGINVIAKKAGQPADSPDDKGGHQIVHDQNFIEKVLRIFRIFDIVDDDVHHDKEEEGVKQTLDKIEKDIYKVADFILPSQKQMNILITNEVNKIINQSVTLAVDRILDVKTQTGMVDPNIVATIFEEEFGNAKKVINDMIAKKIAVSLSTNEIPPPPYSPLINNISLNYSSSKKLSRKDDDKLFHLTAMAGVVETNIWEEVNLQEGPSPGNLQIDNITGMLFNAGEKLQTVDPLFKTNYIIPQSLSGKIPDSPLISIQGMVFIGIKDMVPGQNLSLLFQVAEGTKNNDQKPPPIYWFYIRNNEWVTLKKDNLVSDSTHDLQTTGIIQFAIPGDADNTNTYFDIPSHYWLCAGVATNTGAFPFLIDVKAQGVSVTLVDYKNNTQHLALPLEAQKIKTVLDEIPQVKKVSQPASSFNGKVGEKETEYYTRVSERLRHKARAINNWDYENLVLEKFPSFFKIKCLNNYYNGHFAVGHVTIVPIADLRNKNYAGSNLLVPKTNYIDLIKIEEYLSSKSSPFVKIHAVNPKLEHVLVSCRVKFYTGINKGFYMKQLNDDLVNFLTPWADDVGKISFSGKVYASSMINFIDKREYVDYVQNLEMFQYTGADSGEKIYVVNDDQTASLVETQLTTEHSILVSAPIHYIELIE